MSAPSPIRLTVALLTYNRSRYLVEAVNGILAQTYRDFEFLILDNGSTDDTPQVVLALNDSRIRYVRNPIGSSIEFNSVSAFHIARGHRIIATHDDDIMEPTMLEKQMKFMDENPDVKLVWTNTSTIDHEGNTLCTPSAIQMKNRLFRTGEYIANFLNERIWPMPSTVMLERGILGPGLINRHYFCTSTIKWKVSNKDVAGIDDVTIPAKINTRHSIGYLGEPLLKYRVHPAQGTNAVNLSKPSIYLYRALRRFARKIPGNPIPEILFDSHLLKHKSQHEICSTQGENLNARSLARVSQNLGMILSHQPIVANSIYPVLPIYILLTLCAAGPKECGAIKTLPPPEGHTRADRFFYLWAQRAATGDAGILAPLPKNKNIAILGSAFVAALLILEAKLHGYHVVCCLDSNKNRQGKSLLGVPIQSPAWLAQNGKDVDLVMFSSEKDQEPSLRQLIQTHAGPNMPTLSWKNLLESPPQPNASHLFVSAKA